MGLSPMSVRAAISVIAGDINCFPQNSVLQGPISQLPLQLVYLESQLAKIRS